MDTIRVYLDNMFAGLPKTMELERMKQELLSGMEEKYLELKQDGKTENEAIGIVISEFGNIEELTAELGIEPLRPEEALPVLAEDEAYAYIAAKRTAGLWNGLGGFCCIFGVGLMIVLNTLFDNQAGAGGSGMVTGTLIGLVGMFVIVALAVGMFIYSSMKLKSFEHLDRGFGVSYSLRPALQQGKALFAPTYRVALITGVCLCVLSPIFVFTGVFVGEESEMYGLGAMLLTVAVAVFLFIYYGSIQGAYNKLLEEKEPAVREREREEENDAGHVAAVVWPLATALFLFIGFVFNRWDVGWVVFPITGILFSVFVSLYRSLRRKDVS